MRLSAALALASLAALGGGAPSRAQDSAAQAAAGAPAPTLREMVRSREEKMRGDSLKDLVRALPPNLPAVLGLDGRQVERLDRLHGDFLLARVEQEAKIARWQGDLSQAQSPTSFNEGLARGLARSIAGSQEKIRDALLRARGGALKVLTPAQRAQVQALSSARLAGEQDQPVPEQPQAEPEARLDEPGASSSSEVREDAYSQLLLMPVERLLQLPLDIGAARRVLAERDRNRYARSGYGSGRYSSGRYGSGRYGGGFGGGFGFGIGRGYGFGGIYGSFGHRDTYGGHRQHGGAHH